ncbi:MAG: hypothetical protein JRJ03_00440 [Deltaproteobacteria bacterium]|nr:hypothetical protein [Deltaproteobacteria bacterium]
MQNEIAPEMVKRAIHFVATFFKGLSNQDKDLLPQILKSDGDWMAAYDVSVLAIFFLGKATRRKVFENRREGWPPFPGLLVGSDRRPRNAPVAIEVGGTCNYFVSNHTANMFAFSVQPGASFTIVDHFHEVRDSSTGKMFKYQVDIGFVLGISPEENWPDVEPRLKDLLRHTMDVWAKIQ